MSSRYYIGSCRLDEHGEFVDAYFVIEDFINALRALKDDNAFPEDLRHEETGDFFCQFTLSEKAKPDKDGRTHAFIMTAPYVPPTQENVEESPVPSATKDEADMVKEKRLEMEEDDGLDISKIPF